MVLKPPSHSPSGEWLAEPALHQRNLTRTRRANAFLRRRGLNAAALLAGNAAAWTATWAFMHAVTPDQNLPQARWATLFILHCVLMYGGKLLPGWGLGIVGELRYTVQLTALLLFGSALSGFLVHQSVARELPHLLLLALLTPLLLLTRSLIKGLLLRAGVWGVPVVVYGGAATGGRVIRALHDEPGLGYHPVAVYDDAPHRQGTDVDGVPVAGPTSSWTYETPVAILAMPGAPRARQVELLDGPLSVYRSVIVIPDLFDVQSLWARTNDLGGILGVRLNQKLADPVARRTKRLLDLLAVTVTAPFWGPLCVLIGLLIWLEDRRHPLFLQPRIGLGGATFSTWKFRTMVPNAEAVLQERLANDPALRAEWEEHFKLRRDPRITRIGRILRKTSLDELPQLVNVLRGEMALIGPRPLPSYHHDLLPAFVRHLRREMRPGMTGLWQVSGRSDAGNDGMIQHDPYYVRNWSVWLDAVILMRTFRAVIRSAGAY
ncbi:exopolysaccharide biosynthesis polyprenyl glycosylphosphotransferase [Deinococcus sp. ME38]|uniref:exopolysaccharide biosynthesis polyprenyl glycosylphosphotransferase n=1 Tax=Deinococcus sp. ME38 TaxID=3400344 RepID=UPI003B5BB4FB